MIKRRCRLRREVPSAFEVHTADRTVRFEVESALYKMLSGAVQPFWAAHYQEACRAVV